MSALTLTYLGKFWGASGDLFSMSHPDGQHARVYVDSLGETWVDIRRIPEGGYFHTERVESWPARADTAEAELRQRGFDVKRSARYAHRVHERPL